MWKSREIQLLVAALTLISLTATGLAYFLLSPQAALFVVITSSVLIDCMLMFTKWRYNEIAKLSSYLRRISNGDYTLDVRDNYEGELSILKSNIYKVTLMLSEKSTLLQEEKLRLTDAISDISHQLKTPLTSMTVMVDLLSDSNLQEEKRAEFTHNIGVQLERMEWLVSSLLKLSKIDAGTAVFKKDTIRVQQLIERAVKPVVIPMDIKEQTLKLNGDPTVSLIGDLNWTTEALINLLKNSVEHTGNGGEVAISFHENALFTEIIIQDNGKGIPKEDLPYIFKRFYRGKNASEDSVGIGLAMAYSIIKSQNGDIEVMSELGKGTQFKVKFYKQVI